MKKNKKTFLDAILSASMFGCLALGVCSSLPVKVHANADFYTITNGSPSDPNGSISVGEQAAEGEPVTVTAYPAEGYRLKSLSYEVGYSCWSVTGDFGGLSWSGDIPMVELKPNVFYSQAISFNQNEQFKIRKDGKWDVNYGGSTSSNPYIATPDVSLEAITDGSNISVPTAGTYVVIYKANSAEITLSSDTTSAADPVEITGGVDNIYSFNMPASNITVTGIFEEIPNYYIEHGWTDASNWTWEQMTIDSQNPYIFTYAGKWTGTGCNVNNKADETDAHFFGENTIIYKDTKGKTYSETPTIPSGSNVLFSFNDKDETLTIVYGTIEEPIFDTISVWSGNKELRDLTVFYITSEQYNWSDLKVGDKLIIEFVAIDDVYSYLAILDGGMVKELYSSELTTADNNVEVVLDSEAVTNIKACDGIVLIADFLNLSAIKLVVPHKHALSKTNSQENSTCVKPGHYTYYECSCGKCYTDEELTQPILDLQEWLSETGEGYIAPLGHDNMTHHEAVAPSCTEDGTVEYWTCSRESGVYYADAQGTQTLTSIVDSKLGHNLGEVSGIPATENNDGYQTAYKCSICNIYFEDEAGTNLIGDEAAYNAWKLGEGKINKLDHDMVLISGNPATEGADGFKDAYKCNNCSQYFEDEARTKLIGDEAAYNAWKLAEGKINKLDHNMVLISGNPATEGADGFKDAYKCNNCGKYFEDEEGTKLIGGESAYNAWKLAEGKIPAINPQKDNGLSGGAIAGIAIGSFVGLCLIAYIAMFFVWKKNEKALKFLIPSYKWINRIIFKK